MVLQDKRLLSLLVLPVQMGSSFVRQRTELVNVSHQTITPGVWETRHRTSLCSKVQLLCSLRF